MLAATATLALQQQVYHQAADLDTAPVGKQSLGDKAICGQQQHWRCGNKVYYQAADLNTAPVCKQS